MTAREHEAGVSPSYTVAELAVATGFSERTTRRLLRALGFPDSGDGVRYTESDRAAFARLAEAVGSSDLIDMPTIVRVVRSVGQSAARMSDWQVAAFATRADHVADEGARRADACSRHDLARRLAGELDDAVQELLVHSWRRHLNAALGRLDVPDLDEDSATVTVGFADLVGFSALSNELDTSRLGELVELFEARCGDVVTAHEGRLVKTLGDSVLFTVVGPTRAMAIAEDVVEVIGHDPRLPDVRIGLATGQVVTRLGDVFGPPVNLAARLTALARRNRVLTDAATAAGLPRETYEGQRLTARPLRGFGLVEPVAVRRR